MEFQDCVWIIRKFLGTAYIRVELTQTVNKAIHSNIRYIRVIGLEFFATMLCLCKWIQSKFHNIYFKFGVQRKIVNKKFNMNQRRKYLKYFFSNVLMGTSVDKKCKHFTEKGIKVFSYSFSLEYTYFYFQIETLFPNIS